MKYRYYIIKNRDNLDESGPRLLEVNPEDPTTSPDIDEPMFDDVMMAIDLYRQWVHQNLEYFRKNNVQCRIMKGNSHIEDFEDKIQIHIKDNHRHLFAQMSAALRKVEAGA